MHFGMEDCAPPLDALIMTASDDHSIVNENRSDWNAMRFKAKFSLFYGGFHKFIHAKSPGLQPVRIRKCIAFPSSASEWKSRKGKLNKQNLRAIST
jgi:hypothetical protein